MASGSKSTLFEGVNAFLFLAFLGCSGYLGYLHLTERELSFHNHVLTANYLLKPAFVIDALAQGGWYGTAIGIATISTHLFVYGLIIAFVTGITTYLYLTHKKKVITRKAGVIGEHYLGGKQPEAEVVLSVFAEDRTNENGVTQKILKNVFPETYLRLDRARLTYNREPANNVEALEWALWKILCAHKEWPADPNGHHADVPLYLHSRNVAEKLAEVASGVIGGSHLSRVIGLGHDIGKIMAYEKNTKINPNRLDKEGLPTKEVRWKIRTKQHDSLSAHIVRLLPEFKRLSPSDQNTVDVVLSYSHKPDKTPKRRTTHVELTMLRHLRTVDGLATGEDQSKISDLVHDPAVMQEIKEGLSKLIPQLNINEKRAGSGYADGWTSGIHDYIAVKESSLRQGLDGHLSPKLTIAMALKTEKTRHPATPVIRQALEQMNYLITELNGSKPANALFSMTVGKVKFEGVFLLRRDLLEKEALDIVEGWGECKYPLKVNTYQPVELEQEGSNE